MNEHNEMSFEKALEISNRLKIGIGEVINQYRAYNSIINNSNKTANASSMKVTMQSDKFNAQPANDNVKRRHFELSRVAYRREQSEVFEILVDRKGKKISHPEIVKLLNSKYGRKIQTGSQKNRITGHLQMLRLAGKINRSGYGRGTVWSAK